MNTVPVPGNRAMMMEGVDGLNVVIPAKKVVVAMILLPLWLAGWTAGEVTAIVEVLRKPGGPPAAFMIVWLAVWTVGGTLASLVWLWMAFGRERVILRPDALVIRHELLGLKRAREFALGNISNLRVTPEPAREYGRSGFPGPGGGVIAFDYGAKTFRFGGPIHEPEAREIVARMEARYKFAATAARQESGVKTGF